MEINKLKPRKALNKAFLRVKPSRAEIEGFKTNLIQLLDRTNDTESEEFHKNLLIDFLKKTYYEPNHFINTKGRNDLVIHNGDKAISTVGVIIEAKKPTNKSEMVTTEKLNTKAFQELVLYYLRERITQKNLEAKHLIISNVNEWFIFDATIFDRLFAQNKYLVTQFNDFEDGRLADTKTEFFYKQIAEPFIESVKSEIEFTYFNLKDYQKPLRNNEKYDDNKLIALFKILSPQHLLKLPFTNDSNSLDKRFYSELLHIIGLSETKEGGKKLIQRNKVGERHTGTMLEDAIIQIDSLDKISRLERPDQFGSTQQERLFNVALELSITWINRILFLKLLEAQLITYHKGDKTYSFLNLEKIKNYDDLNSLFFQVLARNHDDRNEDVIDVFKKVPYLNSSLFEPTSIEQNSIFISNLRDDKSIPIIPSTVLKDLRGKRRVGKMNALAYLFEFLDAYDFRGEGSEEIQEENKSLINASVLGLIFEKINGYKDGSYFTPGFITMYMCRETIRQVVVQRFNETKNWKCKDIDDLYDKIENRDEANRIVNSLKICDPAVGSGHFLVSALNEMISVKNDLKILQDRSGKRLKEYQVEVVNDELIVTDEEGQLFDYNPNSKESQRIQEALFHEKQTIIENCLFGVDINPNSVKICRLRLWIELLKNAYYKNDTELETLPNIDINIKCGNSLVSRFDIDADLKKALKKSNWSIDSYRIAVDSYRNAQSKGQKREMEQLISDIKSDFESEISANYPKVIKLRKLSAELSYIVNQGQLFELSKKEKTDLGKKVKRLTEDTKNLEAEIEDIKANKIFENAFEWRFEFPEVMSDVGDFVGFDIVMGNPPYGSLFGSLEKAFIKNNYKYTDYQFDIYMSFFERSFHLLKPQAQLCFIVPNTWLLNLKTPNIRNLLFNELVTQNVRAYDFPVFGEAIVDTVIVSALKSCAIEGAMEVEIISKSGDVIENSFPRKKLSEEYKNHVNIYLSKFASNINFKFSGLKKLEDVAKITQGSKPFQKGKGVPKQDSQIMLDKPFVQSYKKDSTFRPLLRGSLMNKFVTLWDEDYYISLGDWLAEPRYSANYDAHHKIIIRQTGSSLIATLDTEQFVVRDNLYTVVSIDDDYSEYVILAILNSKLVNWYYQNIINNEVGEALAQVKKGHLSILPIPNVNEDMFEEIKILTTSALELKRQDKSADISWLEEKIDQLVYSIYELTKDEIEIIEAKI